MAKRWFDEQGILLFDEYVFEMPAYKKILEDGIITDEELKGQAEQVISILKKLDTMLSDEEKDTVTEAFCEMALLYQLSQKKRIDEIGMGG